MLHATFIYNIVERSENIFEKTINKNEGVVNKRPTFDESKRQTSYVNDAERNLIMLLHIYLINNTFSLLHLCWAVFVDVDWLCQQT